MFAVHTPQYIREFGTLEPGSRLRLKTIRLDKDALSFLFLNI
jgi:hypothetical protein